MAFVPVPNGAEAVVRYTRDGQNLCNTFYATKTGAWVQADLDDLAQAVDEWVANNLLELLPADVSYVGTYCRDLRTAVGYQAVDTTNAGPGTAGASSLANNSTLAISRRSGLAGRNARGRIFMPGISDFSRDGDNRVSSGFVAAIETAMDALKSTMDSVDWVEVIVSRVSAGVPLTTAVVYTVVEYIVVDTVLDSMRRRLPGRGT